MVLAITSFLVAGFYGWRLSKGWITGYAALIASGVVLTALGVGLHRAWWGVTRSLEVHYPGFMEDSLARSWATLVFIGLAVAGYALHLSPVLRAKFGEWWIAAYVAFCAIIFAGLVVVQA